MKTEKKFKTLTTIKTLMVLPVIAIMLVAFYSCGNKKSPEAVSTENSTPIPTPVVATSDEIFVEVDEMAQFTGGNAGLLKYIANSTKYPEEAKKNNITGRVIVKFVVEKDCSVSQVEISQGVNPLLDAEALRVVQSMPKFEKPAIKSGNPVAVQFMLPITFALQ